eukprot:gene989-1255_t
MGKNNGYNHHHDYDNDINNNNNDDTHHQDSNEHHHHHATVNHNPFSDFHHSSGNVNNSSHGILMENNNNNNNNNGRKQHKQLNDSPVVSDVDEEISILHNKSNYYSSDLASSTNGRVTHPRGKHHFTEMDKIKMSDFESLDFPIIDNQLYREFLKKATRFNHILKTFGKWAICFAIGVSVGLFAYIVKQSVEFVQEFKFKSSEKFIHRGDKFIGFLVYYSINLLFGILASLVIIPVGQIASGSGIPEVKGYLNGIRIPHSMNVRTLLGKTISLIFSYSSGLVLGPEGPMIHIGSMVGGAVGQVKSKTLKWYPKVFWRYHNDRDRRDFISTGCAAGIAAAFGAPIGGVLFGFEEASSFWSRQLTWRTFFACLIATFTTNVILQGFEMQIHDYGVLTFGFSSEYLYRYSELIGFAGIGVLGGLFGAFFVYLNVRLSKWRSSFYSKKKLWWRVIEVIFFISLSSSLFYAAASFTPCIDIPSDPDIVEKFSNDTIRFFCSEGQYNDMAGLSFNTLDAALRLLYNRASKVFTIPTLVIFTVISFFLTTVTSGLMLASGLFIPMMLVGGSLGRLVGQVGAIIFSHSNPPIDPSIYAMVGSSAMMAGFSRMTISLAVIIVELTEGTQYMLPVILSVMIAKWVGDIFNESIYEHLMEQKCYPFLPTQPTKSMNKLGITDVMKSDVITLYEVEKVSKIIQILNSNQHHGFPVIERPPKFEQQQNLSPYGNHNNKAEIFEEENTYCGMILRSQLIILLNYKIFCHEQPNNNYYKNRGGGAGGNQHPTRRWGKVTDYGHVPADGRMTYELMTQSLARHFPPIDKMDITKDEIDNMYIDLRPYMNLSSIVANETYSFAEAYQLFRTMGLRHLPVVNKRNEVVDNGLGLTPQMGWSSWNYFGCNINETIIMDIAQAMVSSGMKDAGYEYVNIDDCWAVSRDSDGVIQADPKTFPHGIQYIADYVHSLGLKLGIYTDAGVYTCQKRPGSFGYEQIDAKTYASWGIDYLKEDWCYAFLEQPLERYQIMSAALNATGRPIFFSLCDWGTDSPWLWGNSVGNSWRTTKDIQNNWDSFLYNLDAQIPITSFSQIGGWNDPDMLEVGNPNGMTNTEFISHFSLWSLLSAPLIAGNDLRNMDQATISILTAPEVIAVNQDPLGKQGFLVKSFNGGLQQIWARPLADGSRAVVLFNSDSNPSDITLSWADIWSTLSQTLTVRDLWARSDLGTFTSSYTATSIEPHGCVILYSTSTTPPPTNEPKIEKKEENENRDEGEPKTEKPRFRKTKWFLGLSALGIGSFQLVDLIINDDFDSITDRFRTRLPVEERKNRPKVVILGTGWGSLCFLRKLHTDQFDVTIVSPRNYFLFTPLLVGGTTGTVEVRSIMEPIRKYCRRSDAMDANFIEAECIGIDPKTKKIKCYDNSSVKGEVSEFELSYDHLIVGVGSDNQTFGIPGVRENACFLKEIQDTRVIRDKIIDCLETAGYPGQPQKEIDRLLNWVIVGGGPSGVEFCAELRDFLQSDLLKNYPLAKRINVTLVEALPHILTVFDKKIIDHVERRIQSTENTQIWTKTAVTSVREKDITVRNEFKEERDVPYGLLVWCTGNTPRKITTQLMNSIGTNVQNNRRGLLVDDYFRVLGADGIWAIGDCSISVNKPLAQTAQVASQQGRYLGRLFNQMADEMDKDKKDREAKTENTQYDQILKKQPLFKYKHYGTLAYVGDHQAVAEFKGDGSTTSFEGYITYYLWRSVYFTKLLSVRNRVLVTFDWMKSTVFGRDISRG